MAPSRIALLYVEHGPHDAIGAASRMRTCGLRAVGVEAELFLLDDSGRWRGADRPFMSPADFRPDTVLLEYNPFSYGRRGFAPKLVPRYARLRSLGACLAIMCHETFASERTPKARVMRQWQRAQLVALCAASDVVLASTQRWLEQVQHVRPRRPTFHLPVGSNVPDERAARRTSRGALGIEPGAIVLCAFGQAHHSRRPDHVVKAANHTVNQIQVPVHLLNLGVNAPAMSGLHPGIRVHSPGWLTGSEVARALAAADIYLAPFGAGVSTRRGSVMAALQHALPVVATKGRETDPIILGAEPDHLCLVHAGDSERFALSVGTLARDPERRQRLGAAGRALYEERFAWEPLAKALLKALDASRLRRAR